MRASKMTTFSAPPHHTRGRDDGGNKNKMLASTMQFPNNNPHRALHTPPKRQDASTRPEPGPRAPHHGGTPTRNNHPRTHRRITPPTDRERPVLLSQDPTVCQHPHAHPDPATLPFPSPARHRGPRPRRPFQTRYYENPPAGTTTGHDSLMFHP